MGSVGAVRSPVLHSSDCPVALTDPGVGVGVRAGGPDRDRGELNPTFLGANDQDSWTGRHTCGPGRVVVGPPGRGRTRRGPVGPSERATTSGVGRTPGPRGCGSSGASRPVCGWRWSDLLDLLPLPSGQPVEDGPRAVAEKLAELGAVVVAEDRGVHVPLVAGHRKTLDRPYRPQWARREWVFWGESRGVRPGHDPSPPLSPFYPRPPPPCGSTVFRSPRPTSPVAGRTSGVSGER